jgi:hypothetical protein
MLIFQLLLCLKNFLDLLLIAGILNLSAKRAAKTEANWVRIFENVISAILVRQVCYVLNS